MAQRARVGEKILGLSSATIRGRVEIYVRVVSGSVRLFLRAFFLGAQLFRRRFVDRRRKVSNVAHFASVAPKSYGRSESAQRFLGLVRIVTHFITIYFYSDSLLLRGATFRQRRKKSGPLAENGSKMALKRRRLVLVESRSDQECYAE